MHWLDQLKLWLINNGPSASLALLTVFICTILIIARFA